MSSSTRFHWPTRRRGAGSLTNSSVTSNTSSGAKKVRGLDTGGRSLDDYIHSLDAAKARTRGRGKGGQGGRRRRRHHRRRPPHHHTPTRGARWPAAPTVRESSGTRTAKSRERSGERGRASSRGYTPKAGKRSPRSPVPMSPEDLMNLSTTPNGAAHEGSLSGEEPVADPATAKKTSRPSSKSAGLSSRTPSRRRSPERGARAGAAASGPGAAPRPQRRPRGSAVRSPSSPLPMSANAQYYQASDEDDDDEYDRGRAGPGQVQEGRQPQHQPRRQVGPRAVAQPAGQAHAHARRRCSRPPPASAT